LYNYFGDTVSSSSLTGIREALVLFMLGCTQVYPCRVTDGTDAAATTNLMDTEGTPAEAAVATGAYTGTKGNQVSINVRASAAGVAGTNDITVTLGSQSDNYYNVSVDPTVTNNLFTQSANSQICVFTAPGTAPAAYPGLALGTFTLTGGVDGITTVTGTTYIGTVSGTTGAKTGLQAMSVLPNGATLNHVFLAGQSDAPTMTSLFSWASTHNVQAHASIPKATLTSALAAITQGINNQFASYAYVWQTVTDPFTGATVWTSPAAWEAGKAASGNAWDSIANNPLQGSTGMEFYLSPADDFATVQAARVNAIANIPAGGYGFTTEFNLSTNNAENQISDTAMQMYIAAGELAALSWAGGKLMNTSWMSDVLIALSSFLDPLVRKGIVGDVLGVQPPYSLIGDTTNNSSTNLSQGIFNVSQVVLLIPHNRKLIITGQISRTGSTLTISGAAA